MSNNKQIMKLYTEEQVRKAIELAQECEHDGYYPVNFDYSQIEIFEHLTPIEIPTDEEILDLGPFKSTLPYNVVFYDGWLEGATSIRNLIIKRGNNEQQ